MNIVQTIILSSFFSLIAFFIIRKTEAKSLYKFLIILIVFLGSFIRLYQIDIFPVGLNQDEASIGYEAISLYKYGIDRFGMSYPVNFISWGSGQNVLYAYLILPLVKIVSNEILLIRLPMAIIGIITILFILYFIKYKQLDGNGVLILLLFVIMPWHIMKSRWALESNVFPDLVFYCLIFLSFAVKENKKIFYLISSVIFGLSTYSYGTSYMYIPMLLLLLYLYLLRRKKISLKEAAIYFLLTGLVSLPMVLFVIINYFDLNTIKIFKITIPKLYYNRFTAITSVNGNFITNCISNFISTIKIIITGRDNMPLNSMSGFGNYYRISFPLLIYGLFIYYKKYRNNDSLNIAFISLISGLIVSMMVIPNINRINFLWIPIYIFIVLGIVSIKNRIIKTTVISILLLSFINFSHCYFNDYQKYISVNNNEGLKEAIKSIDTKKNIYITNNINQPYIFWLYYNKISPHYYINNRKILDYNVMFQTVNNIGKVYFYIPKEEKLKKGIYIISASDYNNYIYNKCKKNKYSNFYVLDC